MKKKSAITNEKLDEIGEAIAAAGFELQADGLLHAIDEMLEENPNPAIEACQIVRTIGYSAGLIDIWCAREFQRRGW